MFRFECARTIVRLNVSNKLTDSDLISSTCFISNSVRMSIRHLVVSLMVTEADIFSLSKAKH